MAGRRRSRSSCKKKRKKEEKEDGIDRLSELHDTVIVRIFSFLDMKDVVKTSVLSKRWKDTWTNADTIAFDFDIEFPYAYEKVKRFISFVDRTFMVISQHDFQIKKFCIRCDYQGVILSDDLVDKWLDFVLRRNVEVLRLEFEGLNYLIPSSLFRSSSLEELAITQVGVNYNNWEGPLSLPYYVSIVCLESEGEDRFYYNKKFDVSWNHLKRLSLTRLYVPQVFMDEMLSGCPVLETLVLETVTGFTKLKITSPNLNGLKLVAFVASWMKETRVLEITAPWIKNLEISGGFNAKLIDVSSVKNAKLTLNYYDWGYGDAPENPDIIWSDVIDKLLVPVSHADELTIGTDLLQALSLLQMTNKRSMVFKCKYMTIHSSLSKYEVHGIVCLLESSPNLETLVIRVMAGKYSLELYSGNIYAICIDRVFKSFCAIDYLSQQKKKIPCLKNVKIDFEAKKYYKNEKWNSELEITAYVLRNAQFLEKLDISFSTSNFSRMYPTRYLSLLSSRRKVGEKAVWKANKVSTTYEFRPPDDKRSSANES